MNRLILAAIMAVGVTGLASAPASARNYDCTKAGNANKAECKSGAKPTPKAVAAKPAAKAATKPATKTAVATKTVTKVETKTVVKSERSYDCTKAGNKNKAACKTAAKPMAMPAPVRVAPPPARVAPAAAAKPAPARSVAVASAARNYDCAKAGNANKAVCKAAPTAKPKAPSAASADDKNPAGAIARCRDGMYSHSKQRVGACSRHGGVAKWN